jgi:hypothetical protein
MTVGIVSGLGVGRSTNQGSLPLTNAVNDVMQIVQTPLPGGYHRLFHTSGLRLPGREADHADLVPTTTQPSAMPHVPNVFGGRGTTLTVLKRHDVNRCVVVLLKVKGKDALSVDCVCPSVCGPVSAATRMVGFFFNEIRYRSSLQKFYSKLEFHEKPLSVSRIGVEAVVHSCPVFGIFCRFRRG